MSIIYLIDEKGSGQCYSEYTNNFENMVGILEESKLVQICIGFYHILILDESGNIWSHDTVEWEKISPSCKRWISSFKQINLKRKLKQISCGDKHAVAIDNNGNICYLKNNFYKPFGYSVVHDQYIDYFPIGNKITKVVCGSRHTIALDENGNIWSHGQNIHGQLGLGHNEDIKVFEKVSINKTVNFEQISCGNNHSVLLDTNGSIWSCGSNFNGVSGLGSIKETNKFTKIKSFYDENDETRNIISICCGYMHTVSLDIYGRLWVCGNNQYGQLGLGNFQNRSKFSKVSFENIINQISCVKNSTFILDNEKNIFFCGYSCLDNYQSPCILTLVNCKLKNNNYILPGNLFCQEIDKIKLQQI